MKKNMGTIDKTIRILIAVVIFVLDYTKVIQGTFATILIIIGAIFIVTSIISFCPLYLPFGISTCKKEKKY